MSTYDERIIEICIRRLNETKSLCQFTKGFEKIGIKNYSLTRSNIRPFYLTGKLVYRKFHEIIGKSEKDLTLLHHSCINYVVHLSKKKY